MRNQLFVSMPFPHGVRARCRRPLRGIRCAESAAGAGEPRAGFALRGVPVIRNVASALMLFGLSATLVAPANAADVGASVLTQHNDNHRTGAYLHETALTPASVSAGSFRRLHEFDVDGIISAQPLYVAGLDIPGTPNAAFVATNNNSIFRLVQDPHTRAWTSSRFWYLLCTPDDQRGATSCHGHARLAKLHPGDSSGAVTMPGMLLDPRQLNNKPCMQTRWPVGIVSTPVIDGRRNVMYFVYRVGADYPQSVAWPDTIVANWYLAAIDIRDGRSIQPPVRIADLKGDFAPEMQLNRPGLLLTNGTIYIGFGAAVCDSGGNPNIAQLHDDDTRKKHFHGWVFAYKAATLRFVSALNTSPESAGAGIWQSGNGLAAGDDGFVYAMTGNNSPVVVSKAGEKNVTKPAGLGESFLRLRLSGEKLLVTSIRAGNFDRLDTGLPPPSVKAPGDNGGDADLGSGGPLVLPNGFIAGGGKQGRLYVIGHAPTTSFRQGFQAFFNTWHPEYDPCDYDAGQTYGANIHGAPVLWHPDGETFSWLYGMPEKDYLTAFRVDARGHIEEHPGLTTVDIGERSPDGMPGGFLSISANGGHDGIVWASVGRKDAPDGSSQDIMGRLVAFDAATLAELWSDDRPENFTKFVPPTIGGGFVFRAVAGKGSQTGRVIVYGLDYGFDLPRTQTLESRRRTVRSVSPVRPVSAVWRNPDHIDLFASTLAAGDVVSTSIGKPSGTPPRQATCPTGWRGWFPIAPNAKLGNAAPVTALWLNTSRLDLFTTGDAGGVMTTSSSAPVIGPWAPVFRLWKAVPGTPIAPAGAPITALWRLSRAPAARGWYPQRLDLFVAADGAVQSTWSHEDGGWQPWFAVRPATGKAVSGAPVTAVWRDPNHLDLFMSDIAGHVISTFLQNDRWEPSWFPLMPATGIARPGAPVTAVWRDHDHLDLFMTDVAGHVVSTYFEHDRWQPGWFALDPANLQADPGQRVSAVWRGHDHLDLFLVDAKGVVRSTYFEKNSWQPHWFAVGSVRAAPGQPVTSLWRPDMQHLDLFLTARNGRVMSTFWERDGGWRDWFAI